MNDLLAELKRRNVFRVAVAYAVVAWLAIQVVDVVAPNMGMPEWVPGFIILLIMIGFPIALIFAWAFEITPDGLRKTAEVDVHVSVTADTGRKIDRMIIATLAVAVVVLLVDRFRAPPGAGSADGPAVLDASIAVLPFVNLSSDPEQEYFSDGISEELLNLLAQIPELRVAARTSSFQFKGENQDITGIGQQLNVAHVLEGSVRKSASGEVRITAQLIDAQDGFHLWSDTYDRSLEDIFAVQDEISSAIVEELRNRLGLEVEVAPAPASRTTNREAHEAYLRGRHLVVQRTLPTIEKAVQEFEHAIELDPEYGLAYAELAMAIGLLATDQYGELSQREIRERRMPLARRALALAPDLAEAHAAWAYANWGSDNFGPVIEGFERAIELNPNYAQAYGWLGNVYGDDLGRTADAMAMQAEALERDPLSIPGIANQARSLFFQERDEEAKERVAKLETIAPLFARNVEAESYSREGEFSSGALGQLNGLMMDPSFVRGRFFLAFDLAFMGLGTEAQAVYSGVQSPLILTWLGDHEGALRYSEAQLIDDPDGLYARRDVAVARARVGDFEGARPMLEEIWRRGEGNVAEFGLVSTDAAMALVAARAAMDPDPEIGEVLEAIEGQVQRWREAEILDPVVSRSAGLAAYYGGDRETGLSLIASAVEAGWPLIPEPAYLAELHRDPGFAPIRAAAEARRDTQRELFLSSVCGDNPYSAVWAPDPATCSTFNAGR